MTTSIVVVVVIVIIVVVVVVRVCQHKDHFGTDQKNEENEIVSCL